ncbi:TPA: hypothetical protein ACHJ05_005329, partial [Escherichia coli]
RQTELKLQASSGITLLTTVGLTALRGPVTRYAHGGVTRHMHSVKTVPGVALSGEDENQHRDLVSP